MLYIQLPCDIFLVLITSSFPISRESQIKVRLKVSKKVRLKLE